MNEELVERGDLDELVRHIDRLCHAGRLAPDDHSVWDELVDLRDRCRRALERGKQLWPAASLAEYRLALEAPGPWAGAVIVEGAGYLAAGPLAEVAACRHTWAELAPHIPAGPLRTIAAHERVVRGEDLTGDPSLERAVLDLPAVLQPWEPTYPIATYHDDRVEFPTPPADPPTTPLVATGDPGRPSGDDDVIAAMRGVVRTWVTDSEGTVAATAVEGDAWRALAALGVAEARLVPVAPAEALAWLAWAGASGGAHGRRRGLATGRFEAWWAAAALSGLLDDWPVPPDELGEAIDELRWYRWDRGAPVTGWHLALVVEDPDNDVAFALEAHDPA